MPSQHTPGPWRLEGTRSVAGQAFNGEWKEICVVHGGSPSEADANARLIMAAPRMLPLLRRVGCSRTMHMDGQPFVKGCPGCDARALLAKIEGRE